jgi:hypothetical protein
MQTQHTNDTHTHTVLAQAHPVDYQPSLGKTQLPQSLPSQVYTLPHPASQEEVAGQQACLPEGGGLVSLPS